MPLTATALHAALTAVGAVGRQHRPLAEIASGANSALAAAPPGLTAAGAASFLATCGQESAYWRTTTEYNASGKPYAPWIGRGYVQVTWAENYRKFGQWCHQQGLLRDPEAFVNQPPLLADVQWAWLTGTWYFARNNLWRYANAGDHYKVSQGVNRGPGAIGGPKVPSHWPEREALYRAFLVAGLALLPSGPAAGDSGRLKRQQALLLGS